MATSFQITIPQPCHENWASMTPEAQGRFCAACQKCVVDMTAKAPVEIAEIYRQHGGNVCGRVRVSQLSRPAPKASLQAVAAQAIPATWSRLRRFAFVLLLAFGFLQGAKAQSQPEPVHVKMGIVKMVETPARQISGTVFDADGEPAANATVRLERPYGGVVAQATTDRKGHYTLSGKWNGDFSLSATVDGEETLRTRLHFDNFDSRDTWQRHEDLGFVEHGRFHMGEIRVEPILPADPALATAPALVTGQKEALVESQFTFTAFPNPATDHLLLTASVASREAARVQVFDGTGRQLEDRNWQVFEGPAHIINLDHHAAGVYFLRVSTSETDAVVRRFVKQ
jgi:Carboxypeptidase regulatory-like domain/Secretion system C-terminal sorting domain